MTQKDKDLLLKDLCARLPYEVKVQYEDGIFTIDHISAMYEEVKLNTPNNYTIDVLDIKPYLYPMSSMTEEQKEDLFKFCNFYTYEDWEGKKTEVWGIEIASRLDPVYCYDHTFRMWGIDMRTIDWLLKNHFDIYGLIPMDLAIDATRLNIY